VLPPGFVFWIFNLEDVSHDDQVSVMLSQSKLHSHDVAEYIKTRSLVAGFVQNLHFLIIIKESQELHALHDIFDGGCEKPVVIYVGEVSSGEGSLYKIGISCCHTSGDRFNNSL